jgi:hypothetical protein
MRAFGISLLVGGLAFLVSGLIFLLPIGRKRAEQQRAIEESREEIDQHLSDLRREQGDLP